MATVSILEKPTFFNIKNDQRGHRDFLNKVAKIAQDTGKTPVFAVEGNSPFAIRTAQIDLKQFALKRIVKTRLRLVKDETRDINLLHSLLSQIWGPDYKESFSRLNSPQALTFFANFPTPEKLNGSEEKMLNCLCKQGLPYYQCNWGKKKIRTILEKTKEMDWHGDEYLMELGLEEINLVRTIAGFNWILACSAVVLIGDLRRFESISDFVAYCGLVLCAKESGKKKRKRRNKLLGYVFYLAALASLKGSEMSRQYYQKKRSLMMRKDT